MAAQLDFKLSLMEMSICRLVANLWTESDMLAYFKKLAFKLFRNDAIEGKWWVGVESKMRKKVLALGFNNSLTQKIIPFIYPIGGDLLRWKLFNEDFLGMWRHDFQDHVYRHIFWTPASSIDYQKTARELVRLGVLDAVKRYKLACLYCLEEYVPTIWAELSEDSRRGFCKQEDPLLVRESQMENFWANLLREEEEEDLLLGRVPVRRFGSPAVFYQRAFDYSAIRGNKAAAEYFFSKLDTEERAATIYQTTLNVLESRNEESPCKSSKEIFIESMSASMRELPTVRPLIELIENQLADERLAKTQGRIKGSFPKEKLDDVFCFFFFQMHPDQQVDVCISEPFKVFRCFLQWPWRGVLSDMAGLVWRLIPEEAYDAVLDTIECSLKFPDDHFSRAFRELFPHSPARFRKQFIERECQPASYTFPKMLHCNALETVKVLLRNVDHEDRLRLIFSPRFFRRYQYFNPERGDALTIQFLLREAGLSRQERENLKKSYLEYFASVDRAAPDDSPFLRDHCLNKRKRFCEIIDQMSLGRTSKRSAGEGTSTEAKKLRPT